MAYEVSIWLLPVLLAITFHEAAQGYVAHLLGDDTAWRLGRVTFNPWKDVDPLPPFDGGRIAVSALPAPLGYPLSRLEPFGFPFLIRLFFILPLLGTQFGFDLSLISRLTGGSANAVIELVLRLTGNVA